MDVNILKKGILEFKHPFLLLGIILTVIEYSIHLAGLDYLIRISFLVTHHFFEMAGMLFFGLWVGRLVRLHFGRLRILGHTFPWIVFFTTSTIEMLWKGWSPILLMIAFFLYTPLLIGFYFYLAFSSKITSERPTIDNQSAS